MIPSVAPEGLTVVEATEAMWNGPLHAREEACVTRAVEKRRREFTAGRNCARHALAQLGISDFPLLPDEDRIPRWPEGIVGTITHTAGYCAVGVARRGHIQSVGIDVEAATCLDDRLVEKICTRAEIDRLSALPGGSLGRWGKVVFSAKESTYKCYYPLARTVLDFPDVEIHLVPWAGRFTATLVRRDKPPAGGARVFHGRFAYNEHRVFTIVTLTAPELSAV
jgi:4'-phosphopantetheinyl transferase EntD